MRPRTPKNNYKAMMCSVVNYDGSTKLFSPQIVNSVFSVKSFSNSFSSAEMNSAV